MQIGIDLSQNIGFNLFRFRLFFYENPSFRMALIRSSKTTHAPISNNKIKIGNIRGTKEHPWLTGYFQFFMSVSEVRLFVKNFV